MDKVSYRRKVLHKCQDCFNKNYLTGQAFTAYTCQSCQKPQMHPNTGVPQICPTCSTTQDQCSYCLKPMD